MGWGEGRERGVQGPQQRGLSAVGTAPPGRWPLGPRRSTLFGLPSSRGWDVDMLGCMPFCARGREAGPLGQGGTEGRPSSGPGPAGQGTDSP